LIDFKLFDKVDADKSGSIDQKEWMRFLVTTHTEKGAKKIQLGDRWLNTLLHTLRRNIGADEEEEDG
jgi:hypothetical protein